MTFSNAVHRSLMSSLDVNQLKKKRRKRTNIFFNTRFARRNCVYMDRERSRWNWKERKKETKRHFKFIETDSCFYKRTSWIVSLSINMKCEILCREISWIDTNKKHFCMQNICKICCSFIFYLSSHHFYWNNWPSIKLSRDSLSRNQKRKK